MEVFSLICWGGRTGKTVSLSASTDVVTLTNHGLRNGTKLWPSGTLPSELNTSTPVYARSTAANTFTLHTSSAGAIANTGQILFAGSSTYAAVVLKSDIVANAASALAVYGLSDLSRWGASGSERIYDGLSNWHAARSGTSLDSEICEIGESFTNFYAGVLAFAMGSAYAEVTSKINGIRTSAFHAGKMPVGTYALDNGFVFLGSVGSGGGISVTSGNAVFDGFSVENVGGSYAFLLSVQDIVLRNMICKGAGSGLGIRFNGCVTTTIDRCISFGYATGFYIGGYAGGLVITNNLATGNTKGFSTDAGGMRGWYFNNVSIGNTTNWDTWSPSASSLICVASNNAGLSGEAWITTGGSRITMATTDFADYANSDFRPALSSSPQVDTGVEFYGMRAYDISDAEVPNYNNGGAEAVDVGCYEFDHGYGPHPASHELTLNNVVVGSRVFIRDQADTVTHYDQIAAASTVTATITVYGDSRDNWRIKVRKASSGTTYIPYETQMTATPGSSSIYVSQIPDE